MTWKCNANSNEYGGNTYASQHTRLFLVYSCNEKRTEELDQLICEIIFGPSELRYLADHTRFSRRDDQKHLQTLQNAPRSFPRAFWRTYPFLQTRTIVCLFVQFASSDDFMIISPIFSKINYLWPQFWATWQISENWFVAPNIKTRPWRTRPESPQKTTWWISSHRCFGSSRRVIAYDQPKISVLRAQK